MPPFRNAIFSYFTLGSKLSTLKYKRLLLICNHYLQVDLLARRTAAHAVESGAARTVKINQFMSVYNANTSGKGRPRPRVRITGLPMKVMAPAVLGHDARGAAYGTNVGVRAADELHAKKLGKLPSDAHWSSKPRFFLTARQVAGY
jgi:hypothetical protein